MHEITFVTVSALWLGVRTCFLSC